MELLLFEHLILCPKMQDCLLSTWHFKT